MSSLKIVPGWRFPMPTNSTLFILSLTAVVSSLFLGCQSQKAAGPLPVPEVQVAAVEQKDVPIYGEWVATLDGYVNAQIQPQVTGYITQQSYRSEERRVGKECRS